MLVLDDTAVSVCDDLASGGLLLFGRAAGVLGRRRAYLAGVAASPICPTALENSRACGSPPAR